MILLQGPVTGPLYVLAGTLSLVVLVSVNLVLEHKVKINFYRALFSYMNPITANLVEIEA